MRSSGPLVATLLLFVAATPAAGRAADDDEGARVYREACTSCHDAKTRPLDALRLSRAQWKASVDRMEGLGTDVPTGKKLSALLDYLERTRGPATAPARTP
jgi:cytochrome c5